MFEIVQTKWKQNKAWNSAGFTQGVRRLVSQSESQCISESLALPNAAPTGPCWGVSTTLSAAIFSGAQKSWLFSSATQKGRVRKSQVATQLNWDWEIGRSNTVSHHQTIFSGRTMKRTETRFGALRRFLKKPLSLRGVYLSCCPSRKASARACECMICVCMCVSGVAKFFPGFTDLFLSWTSTTTEELRFTRWWPAHIQGQIQAQEVCIWCLLNQFSHSTSQGLLSLELGAMHGVDRQLRMDPPVHKHQLCLTHSVVEITVWEKANKKNILTTQTRVSRESRPLCTQYACGAPGVSVGSHGLTHCLFCEFWLLEVAITHTHTHRHTHTHTCMRTHCVHGGSSSRPHLTIAGLVPLSTTDLFSLWSKTLGVCCSMQKNRLWLQSDSSAWVNQMKSNFNSQQKGLLAWGFL